MIHHISFYLITFYNQDEEPDTSNLDVDYNYFEDVIKPILTKRVKTFKNIELVSGWASYQDVNTFDECPIIGFHPYYYNMFIAAGLRENSVQMAPAVGRAMSELLLEKKFKTLNLDIFSWDRLIDGFRLEERLML
jgi:PREDICTED: FAD-dependent oxidoreductase domain-containing protein 1-like